MKNTANSPQTSSQNGAHPVNVWTPLAVFLVGVLASMIGFFLSLLLILLLTNLKSHRPPSKEDILVVCVLALLSIGVGIVCFVRAREGFIRGQVRPLSYREQLFAASLATVCAAFGVLSVLESRQWFWLPMFVMNPMLIVTWLGVAKKRGGSNQASCERKSPTSE